MTDPWIMQQILPFLWAVENLHTTKVPWVNPDSVEFDSRAQEILKKLEKKGEETRKFLTPSPEEGPRADVEVSEEEKPIKRKKGKHEPYRKPPSRSPSPHLTKLQSL
jgi:hypothetical protein